MYKSHKIHSNSVKDALLVIRSDLSSKDQKLINDQLIRLLEFLENCGVENLSPFHKIFKNYELKSIDIKSFIQCFQSKLNIEYHKNVFCMHERELKKTNNPSRNIVINRLAAEFPDEIINYARFHFPYYYPFINTKAFLNTFESYVEELKKQMGNADLRFLNHTAQNQMVTTQTPSPSVQSQIETTQTPNLLTQNQTVTIQTPNPSVQSQIVTTQTPNPSVQNQIGITQSLDPSTQNQTTDYQSSDLSAQYQPKVFSMSFSYEVDEGRENSPSDNIGIDLSNIGYNDIYDDIYDNF